MINRLSYLSPRTALLVSLCVTITFACSAENASDTSRRPGKGSTGGSSGSGNSGGGNGGSSRGGSSSTGGGFGTGGSGTGGTEPGSGGSGGDSAEAGTGGTPSGDAGSGGSSVVDNCTPGGTGFAIDGDVALDKKTCLAWQRTEPEQPTNCQGADSQYIYCWTAAVEQCKALVLGGHDDWRLPSLAELQTIVLGATSPIADPTAFPNLRSKFYWSTKEVSADHAWCMDFSNGKPSSSASKWGGQAFRCVRGPEIKD